MAKVGMAKNLVWYKYLIDEFYSIVPMYITGLFGLQTPFNNNFHERIH